jgi:hypothetical protein
MMWLYAILAVFPFAAAGAFCMCARTLGKWEEELERLVGPKS